MHVLGLEEVAKAATELTVRFGKTITVRGTRQYRRFCPVDLITVRVQELSEDQESKVVKVYI